MSRTEIRTRKESSKSGILHGGQIALGAVLGALGILLFGVLFGFLGGFPAWTFDNSLPAILVACVSLAVAVFALREQARMRQAGTDPVVIAHLASRIDEPIVMQLNLTNVGAGAAINVFAKVEKPENYGDVKLISKPFEIDVLNGLVPLKVILQGKSVTFDLGVGFELLGKNQLGEFSVDLSYQDIEGTEYKSSHKIDVSEFESQPANSPPLTKIWRELEKIQKKIK